MPASAHSGRDARDPGRPDRQAKALLDSGAIDMSEFEKLKATALSS